MKELRESMITESNEFTIEDLGIKNIDVFDIEVSDNHNFFGNNICVHNSVYVNVSDVVDKCKPTDVHDFCAEFARTALEPIIEKTYSTLATKTNAYRNTMKMKLEKISSVAIFTAKKRYILKVLSSEGVRYAEPKIVMKGIEAIKSSTPKICREKFKELFLVLVNGTEKELQDEVESFRKEFEKVKPETLAFPRGVTDVEKYVERNDKGYAKGTPINSRASILHNRKIKELGLTRVYPMIRNGDRIKFIHLKKNNPLKENVIGFIDKLPPEFDLHAWVDYDEMFEKTFKHPLDIILKVIGWKSIPVASLEDFFS